MSVGMLLEEAAKRISFHIDEGIIEGNDCSIHKTRTEWIIVVDRAAPPAVAFTTSSFTSSSCWSDVPPLCPFRAPASRLSSPISRWDGDKQVRQQARWRKAARRFSFSNQKHTPVEDMGYGIIGKKMIDRHQTPEMPTRKASMDTVVLAKIGSPVKPIRKASMEMNIHLNNLLLLPARRQASMDMSNTSNSTKPTIRKTKSAMPLQQPMRKSSMDMSETLNSRMTKGVRASKSAMPLQQPMRKSSMDMSDSNVTLKKTRAKSHAGKSTSNDCSSILKSSCLYFNALSNLHPMALSLCHILKPVDNRWTMQCRYYSWFGIRTSFSLSFLLSGLTSPLSLSLYLFLPFSIILHLSPLLLY